MKLKSHGRYDYSAITERKDYSWPGGKRLAVHFCLNIGHFSCGAITATALALARARRGRRPALRDSGQYRALRLEPADGGRVSRRGDEIVGHGRTTPNARPTCRSRKSVPASARPPRRIKKHESKPPMGWLAPYISQTHASLDLLREAGFRYMMDWPLDDQPVWFRTKHGPILSIPYAHDLNDSLEAVSRRTPSRLYCENLIDQFDEMLEESARRPLVIEHIVEQRERAWLTRPGDIYKHIESLPAGTVPGR